MYHIQHKLRFCLVLIVGLGFVSIAMANNKGPHTWHTVSSSNGTWVARLQMLNEGGSFVMRDGSSADTFTINPNQSQEYGFTFDGDDDFDVAYSLTLTLRNTEKLPQFTSKACVFVITAKGPAQPDIKTIQYNGAQCSYTIIPGRGEDFVVSSN